MEMEHWATKRPRHGDHFPDTKQVLVHFQDDFRECGGRSIVLHAIFRGCNSLARQQLPALVFSIMFKA